VLILCLVESLRRSCFLLILLLVLCKKKREQIGLGSFDAARHTALLIKDKANLAEAKVKLPSLKIAPNIKRVIFQHYLNPDAPP
jgi:hypothetical protein